MRALLVQCWCFIQLFHVVTQLCILPQSFAVFLSCLNFFCFCCEFPDKLRSAFGRNFSLWQLKCYIDCDLRTVWTTTSKLSVFEVSWFSSVGDRAFTAAGLRVWNYLPMNLRQLNLLYSHFRWLLKTLFWAVGPKCGVNPFYLHFRNTLTYSGLKLAFSETNLRQEVLMLFLVMVLRPLCYRTSGITHGQDWQKYGYKQHMNKIENGHRSVFSWRDGFIAIRPQKCVAELDEFFHLISCSL